MKSTFARAGVVLAVFASAIAMAGCQSAPSPPPAPPAPPAPPPPPPPPPPLALSKSVVEAAASYQAYVKLASSLQPTFKDGESIQDSLRQGESYEPKSLARSTVAFAAVVALQEPTFVQGVRTFVGDPAQREEIIRRIQADPNYATSFPGAQAAANLIAARLAADGEAISKAGYNIKQSAYSIQKQKWSMETIKDRDGRLALAKRLNETPVNATPDESATLMTAAMTGQGVAIPPPAAASAGAPTPYTAGVSRSLAIAALAALGAAGDNNAEMIDPLLDENVGAPCLKLAKLNLFQCLAVAKPHYEDVFCLGKHALMDTGECVSRAAGVIPTNFEPPLPPKPVEAPKKSKKGGSHKRRHVA